MGSPALEQVWVSPRRLGPANATRISPAPFSVGSCPTRATMSWRRSPLELAGDTAAYRLGRDRLTCLPTDHVRSDGTGRAGILYRALGVETEVRLDYATQPLARHDRFLLCSDGVHGVLTPDTIADILRERSASDDSALALVSAALDSGSADNCTALVLAAVELPTAESADIGAAISQLSLIPVPTDGETVDGFLLKVLVSDGRYTRLFR